MFGISPLQLRNIVTVVECVRLLSESNFHTLSSVYLFSTTLYIAVHVTRSIDNMQLHIRDQMY